MLQLPVEGINNVMTTNQQWAQTGLGETGEAFLVGPDQTLRSTSRLLIEDPEAYRAAVVATGTPPAVADQIVARGEPHPAAERRLALGGAPPCAGESGTRVETDYLGHTVLSSYAPITLGRSTWAVVAQVDQDEALQPVHRLPPHPRACRCWRWCWR